MALMTQGRRRSYRQDLFGFVFQHPNDFADPSKIAFPSAYIQGLRREPKSFGQLKKGV
jgi:hypothetical protein